MQHGPHQHKISSLPHNGTQEWLTENGKEKEHPQNGQSVTKATPIFTFSAMREKQKSTAYTRLTNTERLNYSLFRLQAIYQITECHEFLNIHQHGYL